MITPEDVQEQAHRTAAQGPALRSLGLERRSQALARAAALLVDPNSSPGRRARADLPGSTGLSPEMVDWALRTTLDAITPASLQTLWSTWDRPPGLHPVPPRLTALVLAGNVFTAAVRPLLFALLAGSPVLCKAASRDDRFPRLVAEALAEVDPTLAAALGVLTFPGGTVHLEDPLLAASDAVMVYGSDATLRALRARVPPTARLLEHGHGTGAAHVPAHVLADPDRAAEAAHHLALDVAAYDQRGCLSPQAVWVEGGQGEAGRRFAGLIQNSLDRWHRDLPKGPLPTDVAAAQSQWRGVLAATGDLFEGPGGAVAVAGNPALPVQGGPPWGPGWRNLLVLPCAGPADLVARLAPLGIHLKALGAGGTDDDRRRLALSLPPPLCPRLGPLGAMQTPPLDALDDGAPPFEGLLRWTRTAG